MSYVDGFLIPVPKSNFEHYRVMAEASARIWVEHGALSVRESVAEDMTPEGGMAQFPEVIGANPDEVVVFSYIAYNSREHRDEVNARVMQDPRIKAMGGAESAPFDCRRMAYGGFSVFVECDQGGKTQGGCQL